MAGGKLSPRQKMINMMYLVLTALLALNVSKEIINAFITIDESLSVSKDISDQKNVLMYKAFQKAVDTDPTKAKPYQEKALKIKGYSDNLVKFIEGLKEEIIKKADGIEGNAKIPVLREVNKQDDYDTPTHVMCGDKNDGTGGRATELKTKLDEFKKNVAANLSPEDAKKFGARLDQLLDTKPPAKAEDGKRTWEMFNFYHCPVVATSAILTKFQNDVKNAESEINQHLYSLINAADYKVNSLEAKVLAKSSYVLTGQSYEADIMLAAFNSTQPPDAYLNGSSTPLPVEGGMAKFKIPASGEGLKKWAGVIKVKDPTDPTKTKDYPFESEYIVSKPAAVISPTKMNVLYIGVENPVSISVPGVPNEKVKISPSGGGITMTKDPTTPGGYIAKVTTQGECIVSVSADFDNKPMKMGEQKFRIKRVPDPVAKVAGSKGGNMSKATLAAQSAVIADLENFDFQLYFKVTKFKMSLYRKGKDPVELEQNSGNIFTPEMKAALGSASPGSKVYFEYVKASGPDGTTRSLAPVNFVLQ